MGIPIPEKADEEMNEEEDNFVGHRKIKLHSPASSLSEEEEASDTIVFTKENHVIKPKTKNGKSLKRPAPISVDELLELTNQESIVEMDEEQLKLAECLEALQDLDPINPESPKSQQIQSDQSLSGEKVFEKGSQG